MNNIYNNVLNIFQELELETLPFSQLCLGD